MAGGVAGGLGLADLREVGLGQEDAFAVHRAGDDLAARVDDGALAGVFERAQGAEAFRHIFVQAQSGGRDDIGAGLAGEGPGQKDLA